VGRLSRTCGSFALLVTGIDLPCRRVRTAALYSLSSSRRGLRFLSIIIIDFVSQLLFGQDEPRSSSLSRFGRPRLTSALTLCASLGARDEASHPCKAAVKITYSSVYFSPYGCRTRPAIFISTRFKYDCRLRIWIAFHSLSFGTDPENRALLEIYVLECSTFLVYFLPNVQPLSIKFRD
jgi:hypothetical protein